MGSSPKDMIVFLPAIKEKAEKDARDFLAQGIDALGLLDRREKTTEDFIDWIRGQKDFDNSIYDMLFGFACFVSYTEFLVENMFKKDSGIPRTCMN